MSAGVVTLAHAGHVPVPRKRVAGMPRAFQWCALAIATGLMALTYVVLPNRDVREPFSYGFVASLGYAHFVGAAWFSRHKMRRFVPQGIPAMGFAVFVLIGLVNLYIWYANSLSLMNGFAAMSHTWLLLALLALVTWHTVENELETHASYSMPFTIGPISRSLSRHVVAIGWTFAVLVIVAATLREYGPFATYDLTGLRTCALLPAALLVLLGTKERPLLLHGSLIALVAFTVPDDVWRYLTFADVYLGASLYHLVSWILLLGLKTARSPQPERRARFRSLLWIHVLPMGVGMVAWFLATPQLREWFFSPQAYLFWTAAHVVQTMAIRGFGEPTLRLASK